MSRGYPHSRTGTMEPGEAWLCAFATVLGLFSVAFPTSMNNFVARLLCIAQIAPATRALDAPRGARRRMVRGAHRRGRAIRPAAVGSGRGADHPSAFLEDGDLVAYQTGAWDVDGVAVGDGEPEIALAFVTLVQLVFTHNCEHGWIYGSALECDADGSLRPPDGDAFVQFGPEQLLARLDGDELGDGYALCDGGKRAVEEARVRLGSWGD